MTLQELITELQNLASRASRDHDVVVKLPDGTFLDIKDVDFDIERSPFDGDFDSTVVSINIDE